LTGAVTKELRKKRAAANGDFVEAARPQNHNTYHIRGEKTCSSPPTTPEAEDLSRELLALRNASEGPRELNPKVVEAKKGSPHADYDQEVRRTTHKNQSRERELRQRWLEIGKVG